MDADFHALSERAGAWLSARGWTAVTAESCTGGGIAAAITATAGSSAWFDRGFITYSNDAKQAMLGVSSATLDREGAVSEAVVAEMVAGALQHSSADVALAVSGVAGPGGGSAAKPVGMVCLGWGLRGRPPVTVTRHFPGDRTAVRQATVRDPLEGLFLHFE